LIWNGRSPPATSGATLHRQDFNSMISGRISGTETFQQAGVRALESFAMMGIQELEKWAHDDLRRGVASGGIRVRRTAPKRVCRA
jgi:hypothetical protein